MRKELAEPFPEVTHVVAALANALKQKQRSRLQVEQTLGYSRGYVSKLFHGTVEMRTRHVFEILRAIGMEPWDFFQAAFPPPTKPAEAPPATEAAAAPAISEDELEARVRKCLLRILMEIQI